MRGKPPWKRCTGGDRPIFRANPGNYREIIAECAAGGGGIVQLGPGVYEIGSIPAGVELRGAGRHDSYLGTVA